MLFHTSRNGAATAAQMTTKKTAGAKRHMRITRSSYTRGLERSLTRIRPQARLSARPSYETMQPLRVCLRRDAEPQSEIFRQRTPVYELDWRNQ